MNRPITYLLFFFGGLLLQAQQFEIISGATDKVSGIERYNLVFIYATDIEISKYDSEEVFLQEQYEKREQKVAGSGIRFKKLWYENRINLFEPTFIQEFNNFRVAGRQVTVAKNITSTEYTMKVEINAITGGYDDFFYVEEGEIGVLVSLFETKTPDKILYAFETVVRGVASADEFERIRTAYGKLGEAISKHLTRKALLKK